MSNEIKAMLWTGGDAPNREAELTVTAQYNNKFAAYWEPGFCGCPDCRPVVGWGDTEMEAVIDYWDKWEDRYGKPSEPLILVGPTWMREGKHIDQPMRDGQEQAGKNFAGAESRRSRILLRGAWISFLAALGSLCWLLRGCM